MLTDTRFALNRIYYSYTNDYNQFQLVFENEYAMRGLIVLIY